MSPGEQVTYYPDADDHRIHRKAVVIAVTPKMVRLEVEGEEKPILCTQRKVIKGQLELIGE